MAFCPSCGATVQGAFCQQCGTALSTPVSTPLSAATAQPAPGQAVYQQAAYPQAAPVQRKTSPIVWILLTVAGIFVLCIVGLVGFGLFVAKTVARNPGLVMAKIITAANPDAEVLSTDPGSQTIRIRDRKTGKEVTLSFDDVKRGRFKISATGDNGEVANVEIGGGEGKMPAWVPAYPGARAQGNLTASGAGTEGMGEGGMVTFTTPDPASKVTAFYEAKCREMGMTVELTQVTDAGGMVMGQDEGGRRTLHVMVAGGSGDTTLTVTYGRKR
jgi:hypothetical protein